MTKTLKFWGTRGSCSVSGREYAKFGGNTPCAELRYDDELAIFDAGTGIRPLGHTLQNEKKIDLFLSHFHWDHLIGFPFFEPIYKQNVTIRVFSPAHEKRSARDLFDDLLSDEFFPVHLDQIQAKLEFITLEEKKPIQAGPLIIDFHQTLHPGKTLCFKIKTPKETIGYVTDNEIDLAKQLSFIEFFKGVDLLIHEAQYSPNEYIHKQGWGHSSLINTAKMIERICPGKWLVTHHAPNHTDQDLEALEKLAQSLDLPCPVQWIGDGHVIDLR
jgi:phosphoribosyl 1,2-cyclic phosphodiesterase